MLLSEDELAPERRRLLESGTVHQSKAVEWLAKEAVHQATSKGRLDESRIGGRLMRLRDAYLGFCDDTGRVREELSARIGEILAEHSAHRLHLAETFEVETGSEHAVEKLERGMHLARRSGVDVVAMAGLDGTPRAIERALAADGRGENGEPLNARERSGRFGRQKSRQSVS
ncbi:hypothetical protein CKO28_17425 [Rhodovibrio sodomensis]|uniref:Uncharacterized protein n=1 Tax=Rhodovibrio sodomensis TaxID=1088 RepID=A0ABS1DH70_9PROT|nr:hypothetical protein [Rhodovibrio sodomensis]MBK1669819.1 hypothetical protein [Rhodovibrio sodomensis]